MPSLLVDSKIRWFPLVAGTMALAACTLNPQPEDPFIEDPDYTGGGGTGGEVNVSTGGSDPSSGGFGAISHSGGSPGSGGMTATGGMGTGGSSNTGGMGVGGSNPAGGAGGAIDCVGDPQERLLDDFSDCDATLVSGRTGSWFAYDSSPELTGTISPDPEGEFALATTTDGDCAVHVVGGGYPYDETEGFGYAGVGFTLDTVCVGGYDASAFDGLSFLARGTGTLRVMLQTTQLVSADPYPNGYVAEVELVSTWERYSVSFDELVLDEPATGVPDQLDPTQLWAIRFEPTNPTVFDFWLDEIAFTIPHSGGGGAGGAGGSSGTVGGSAGTVTRPGGSAGQSGAGGGS
jgi:hypothetical protein